MGCCYPPQPKEIKFPKDKLVIERQNLQQKNEGKKSNNQTKQDKESEQLLEAKEEKNDEKHLTTQNVENINTFNQNEKNKKPTEKPDLAFDKNICNSIAFSLPSRENTDLVSLKDIIKEKSNDLSKKEKAYIIFLLSYISVYHC